LIQVWKGTIRLSAELASSDATVMVYSLNRFPINSHELRIGMLVVAGDDPRILRMGFGGGGAVPTTIMSVEEITLLSEVDPDRVLALTNDHITLLGTPPSCINRLSVMNHLKQNIIEYLSESLVKLRTLPDYKVLRDPVEMLKRLRGAIALTIITAKDLHRLKGRRIRTIKPHLNELFREIPVSRSVMERAKEETSKGALMDPEDGWDVLSEFANLVILPLLEIVRDTEVTGPSLPPAPPEAIADAGRASIIKSLLADNIALRDERSNTIEFTMDEGGIMDPSLIFDEDGEE